MTAAEMEGLPQVPLFQEVENAYLRELLREMMAERFCWEAAEEVSGEDQRQVCRRLASR